MNRPLTLAAAAALTVLFAHAGCGPSGEVPDHPDAGPDLQIDAAPDAPDPMNDPAVDGQLVINEVMVANAVTVVDNGVARDWIELYNPTDTTLHLQGYGVTDDLMTPRKHILGPSVTIPAHGYLLLWADNDRGLGANHLGFQLAKEEGTIALTRPDGTFIDRVQYGAQEVDFSAAREPDGSDHWVIEWHPSPGVRNPDGSGQPVGREDVNAPPEMIPAAGDLSEQVLGYDADPQFAITIGAAEMQALRNDPRTYVPASITFLGRTWSPVGLRLKGVNSFEPIDGKPSFKLDFDRFVEGGRFFGLERLVLNNMHSDFSMMHERIGYWIARGLNVPASRSNHARVSVNGGPVSLYAGVEAVDKQMLKRWFPDNDGTLFEATDVDFQPQYISLFEVDDGPDDRTILTNVASALANPDADAALAAAGQYVDLDEWRRFWAMESLVAQFDAYPYSFPGDDFFVYAPPGGKLAFIPWGMDETFYSGQLDFTSDTMLHGLLATTCKRSPTCWQAYVNAVWDALATAESMNWVAERQRVASRIAPWTAADQRKAYPDSDVATFQMNMYWFVSDRRLNMSIILPPRAP